MSVLYTANSEFYFVRDSKGKFYVRAKEIGMRLGYKSRASYKVKKNIRKRYDCKPFFDFHIKLAQIPKNSLFVEYAGIFQMIDNAYGTENAKLKLKNYLDSLLSNIQKIPLPSPNVNPIQHMNVLVIGRLNEIKAENQLSNQMNNCLTMVKVIQPSQSNGTENQVESSQCLKMSQINEAENQVDSNQHLKMSQVIKSNEIRNHRLSQIIEALKKRNVTLTKL